MAVYTDVAIEDLRVLLEDYTIGTPLSFKGIAEGVENTNYLLKTDKGPFIVTLYEKRVRKEDLPFFLQLLQHCSARGIPCPVPVRNCAGDIFAELNGRPAAILTWLDGVSLRIPEAAHCAAAGKALARLHAAGRDFPLERPNRLGLAGWKDLSHMIGPDADTVTPGLGALVSSTLTHVERKWPIGLPGGIVHADLFPDNVLFIDDKVSGLIDFYFACQDAYAYDLGVMLNAWCFESDGSYSTSKGHGLIEGYESVRPLDAAERSAFPVLAQGAALRFLLTRLADWLKPDATALVRRKDPLEFAGRLKFHRRIQDVSEYGF